MMYDDYKTAVFEDAKDFIDENYMYYDRFDVIYDDLVDSVTGNDNGSYWCNSARAEEEVKDIVFHSEVLGDWYTRDMFMDYVRGGNAEMADVVVRFSALSEVYRELEEVFAELKAEEEYFEEDWGDEVGLGELLEGNPDAALWDVFTVDDGIPTLMCLAKDAVEMYADVPVRNVDDVNGRMIVADPDML